MNFLSFLLMKILYYIIYSILVDEIKSTLGWEPSEVMSMEGMEATYFNGMLSGVSCKVENANFLS